MKSHWEQHSGMGSDIQHFCELCCLQQAAGDAANMRGWLTLARSAPGMQTLDGEPRPKGADLIALLEEAKKLLDTIELLATQRERIHQSVIDQLRIDRAKSRQEAL